MEENDRRRDWESGKDLERSWGLVQKQESLKTLCGSRMPLKVCKGISQVSECGGMQEIPM
jgi:hypothetical protein